MGEDAPAKGWSLGLAGKLWFQVLVAMLVGSALGWLKPDLGAASGDHDWPAEGTHVGDADAAGSGVGHWNRVAGQLGQARRLC